jgi:hypothetical protein
MDTTKLPEQIVVYREANQDASHAAAEAAETAKRTSDGLTIYDLDPHADEEWAAPQTEYAFGCAYAESLRGTAEFAPVDIAEMLESTTDIPPDDYRAMVAAGIENPNARRYWEGFNSVFSA